MTNYVIIGNSAAAIGAVESIRAADEKGQITLISDEPYPSYSRPLISHYLSGEMTEQEIRFRPLEFYSDMGIKFYKGFKATAINPEKDEVILSKGLRVKYDKLLLASGSRPLKPPIKGSHLKGVCYFWKLDDAKEILKRIEQVKEAVVVGGGLVGLSALYGLHKRGIKLTLIEMLPQILIPSLDEAGAKIMQDMLNKLGIRVVTNCQLTEIQSNNYEGEVASVLLGNGERLPCQLLIIAAGIEPNINFVQESGIKIDRGILVNNLLQTNVENIFAAGDATQPYDIIYQENRMMPNWPNAYQQGRLAGSNMVGLNKEYQGSISMTSIYPFNISCISQGIIEPQEDAFREHSIEIPEQNIYKKIVVYENRLVGCLLIGDINLAGRINYLIKNKIDISTIEDHILEEDSAFEAFMRNLRRGKTEGEMTWKEQIGMKEKYKKTIDPQKWRQKEKGLS